EQAGTERRPLTDDRRREIRQTNEALAGEALRTLGVAVRDLPENQVTDRAADRDDSGGAGKEEDVEHDLVFAGLIGMIDPPRTEAREAVARAKAAGIRPLMITGDHPRTASVIARELGIADDDRAITGVEFERLPEDRIAATAA